MVMLEGWGCWVPQRHFSMAVLPRLELSVFYQRPQVPLTACIVLAFRVAAPLALCPHSGQVYWDVSYVRVKKDGVPSGLERGWGRGAPSTWSCSFSMPLV